MAWNPFKRALTAAKGGGGQPAQTAVVKPLIKETPRRAADTTGLPRFNTTASDQMNDRGGDRLSTIRAKLRHAFTPSQPIAERRQFAGRDEVLRTIIRSIEDQRLHVVIYGERGIGKTSLMHVLTQAAGEARYIVVYTSCGANSKFDEIFRAAAAEIPLLFHSGYSPTAHEAETGATLADLLPEEALTPRKFGALAAKLTGTRVLIILDEFDRVDSGTFRRDVAELIKNLSDRLGRVQLVLAGVAADLTELVEHIPSIRRNIFAMRIPKMSEAEVLQIIANGERQAGIKFDAGASASVITVARGSPYLANLLCHHAGHAALDDGRSNITSADVSKAVARALTEFEGRVSTHVQAQVRRLFDEGRAEAMALAAQAALTIDGFFSLSDLMAANELTARRAKEVVDELAAERLIEASQDASGEPGFKFLEEGLPTLIWMAWAQRILQQTARTPRTAAN